MAGAPDPVNPARLGRASQGPQARTLSLLAGTIGGASFQLMMPSSGSPAGMRFSWTSAQ